jgi:hypothetical protein
VPASLRQFARGAIDSLAPRARTISASIADPGARECVEKPRADVRVTTRS